MSDKQSTEADKPEVDKPEADKPEVESAADPDVSVTPPGKKKPWKERLEDHLREYGAIALMVYLTIWLTVWAGFTIAIATGLDVDGDAGGAGMLGIIGAAWLPTKLTQPLRIGATFVVTPIVAGVWHRISGKKKKSD